MIINNKFYFIHIPKTGGRYLKKLFTNNFNVGGYTFGADDKGNSKYIDSDGVMIPTGTHTGYHDVGMTFSNSWTYEPNFIPPDGTTWTNS